VSDDISVNSVDYREIVHSLSDIVLVSDHNGVFQYVSPQVKKVLGYDPEELKGKEAFSFIHPEDLLPAMEALQTAIEEGQYSLEYRVRHRDGHYVDFWGMGRIVQSDGDVKIFAHIRDISERKRTENKLNESRNFLSGILSSIQDGISVLDIDLRIIYANPVMEKWYAKEMPLHGKHCFGCYQGSEIPCDPCPSLRALESGAAEFDIVPGPEGSEISWLELYSYPIKDSISGNVTGIIEFVRDISDRIRAEKQLQEANERFTLASDSAGIGVWGLDLVDNDLRWDSWMFRIYGMDRNDFASDYEAWQKGVHPDDFEEANDSVKRSIEEGIPFDTEFRIIRPDGEVRWIKANAKVIRDENGNPSRMIGTNYDITDEIRIKELLNSEKERAEFYLDLLAHDLGNIHQGISGSIQLLDRKLPGKGETELPLGWPRIP
jgi:PAS domain S-box-containing protein